MKTLWTLLWTAASAPKRFFGWLEVQPTRILRSGLIAYGSMSVFGLVTALGVARATQSDAALPFVFFALVGSSTLLLYAWGFGSIFVQRPGGLELRAWEVTGWSWAPALFGSAAMLIPLLIVPGPALVVTTVGVLTWHLLTLRAGLSVFLGVRATRVTAIYGLYIYALPLVLLGLVMWLALRLAVT